MKIATILSKSFNKMIVAQHFFINMLSLTKVIAQFNTRSPLVQYIDWSRWFVGFAYQGKDMEV
jgi:hypothetical protein